MNSENDSEMDSEMDSETDSENDSERRARGDVARMDSDGLGMDRPAIDIMPGIEAGGPGEARPKRCRLGSGMDSENDSE